VPTALITGVLGQDGSLLAELLVQRGYRVVGVARRAASVTHEIVELDLAARPETLAEIVDAVRPDEVYHLAAAHRSSEQVEDESLRARMTAVNRVAPVTLGRALAARGRGRLVFAASSQMYTAALPARRIDESAPRAPSTFYGETKASALEELARLRTSYGLEVAAAILFNHESPRRPLAFASRKITRAAARIAAGLDRELGARRRRRPPCDGARRARRLRARVGRAARTR
jgi:GDPmannose 4,6-dehydratase